MLNIVGIVLLIWVSMGSYILFLYLKAFDPERDLRRPWPLVIWVMVGLGPLVFMGSSLYALRTSAFLERMEQWVRK